MRPSLLVMFGLLLVSCGDGTLVVGDDPHNVDAMESVNNSDTTTTPNNSQTTAPNPDNSGNPDVTPIPGNNTTGSNNTNNTNNTTGETNNSNNMTSGPTNNMTSGEQFHPMFVAVADFMREKCVSCHDQGQNGNLIVPSPDVSNADLRVNLEGVVATTGRLLIEPNDPAESQAYIMITNSAGEQFPPETIAIVEDWINAGAPYDP